jgi:glycosyltransferase involved in cell wall biosynthesis
VRLHKDLSADTVVCDPSSPPADGGEACIRVLHVVEAFGGGVFEQIRHLTARLPSHSVTTGIAYGERPETPAHLEEMISPAVALFPLPWTERTVLSQLRAARALSRLYADWRPDVIHLHSSFAGLLGAITAPRSTPTVYTPHGYSFTMANHGPLIRAVFGSVERFIASRMTAIGAVSRSEADLAIRVAPLTKVFVINNGVPELDDPVPRRTAPCPGRPSVVAMGRLAPQQRPQETAEILRSVADIADVAWIGDGREPVDREPIERAGVTVTGWLPRDQAVKRLLEADIYVHWAAWDGQPLSVLEAMAMDSVVVCSDIPPLRDIIPDSQRFNTTEETAARIRAILSDKHLYAQCLDSQEAIRSRYSANRMTARWANTYRELVRATHLTI